MARSLGRGGWALSLLLALGCGPQNPAGECTSAVVITIDTLRADQLGFHGGTAHTPNLNRVAAQSLVFDRAYTQAPITHPALSSLWTGLLPSQHGVQSQFHSLAPSVVTVPRIAQRAGLATAAYVANLCRLQELPGTVFHDGFDERACAMLDDPSDYRDQWEWDRLAVDLALSFLNRTEHPFLLWVHLMDPHGEHRPPPWVWDREAFPLGDRVAEEKSFSDYQQRVEAPPPAELERLWALYRAEIEGVDITLGPLLEALDGPNHRSTALVVASDHGEELFESWPYYGHGDSLSEGVLHVPLFVRAPGVKPARHRQPVELLQVAPTILELLDLSAPYPLAGPSLLAEQVPGAIAISQLPESEGSARTSEYRLWPGMEPDGNPRPWRAWPRAPWRQRAHWFQPPGALATYGELRGQRPTVVLGSDGQQPPERKAVEAQLEQRIEALAVPEQSGASIEDQTLEEQLRQLGYLGEDG